MTSTAGVAMHKGIVLTAVCALTWLQSALVSANEPAAVNSELTVSRDVANAVRIRIPARNGKIAWSDVVRGIARAQQLDDAVLRPLLPPGRFNIDRRTSPFELLAISVAVPGVHMRALKENGRAVALEVRIDKDAFESTRRDVTRRIRRRVSKNGSYESCLNYGLKFETRETTNDEEIDLVVVVHGLNSRPAYMKGLASAIREKGMLCGTFGYPNDAPIDEASRRLSKTLKEHASRWPRQNVVLITNSMGGLVARAAIEDPNLDPGNVRQLVMIAPPNRGSQLARVAHGLDVCEFLLTRDEQQHISWCRASIIDGLAEANRDLRPQSEFLRALNARPRNPDVRYSILLGTGAAMTPQRMSELRAMLKRAAERSRFARFFYPMVDGFLEDLDEVVTGKGDGAVAVKRGVLEGVDDIVILPFTHSAALGTTSESVDRELLSAVLARLSPD